MAIYRYILSGRQLSYGPGFDFGIQDNNFIERLAQLDIGLDVGLATRRPFGQNLGWATKRERCA
jgi:hypothetical protein